LRTKEKGGGSPHETLQGEGRRRSNSSIWRGKADRVYLSWEGKKKKCHELQERRGKSEVSQFRFERRKKGESHKFTFRGGVLLG